MKDNSFDRAMSQIVGQHEAETQKEIQARQRAAMWVRIFGRVRLALVTLAIGGIAVTAYFHQDEIAKVFSSKPDHGLAALVGTNAPGDQTAGTAGGKLANTLNTAQENAVKRDAVINEVSGSK